MEWLKGWRTCGKLEILLLPAQILESGNEAQTWLPVLEHLISDCLPKQAGFL